MAIRRAKQKQQVIDKLRQIAPPGEQFIASVHCETGPSPWLNGVFDQVPFLGLIVAFMRRMYFLTLTSSHVVLVSSNRFTNRPGEVLGSWPREAFPVSNVKRGTVWSVMYVQFSGSSKPTRLNVHRYWRSEMDTLISGTVGTAGDQAALPGPAATTSAAGAPAPTPATPVAATGTPSSTPPAQASPAGKSTAAAKKAAPAKKAPAGKKASAAKKAAPVKKTPVAKNAGAAKTAAKSLPAASAGKKAAAPVKATKSAPGKKAAPAKAPAKKAAAKKSSASKSTPPSPPTG